MYQVKWTKEAVHKGLSREAQTPAFAADYQQLCATRAAIKPYPSPELLIGTLHAKPGIYTAKDQILHALITEIQQAPALRQTSFTLLSLGLWPALEHSYYKLLPLCQKVPDLFAALHGYLLDEAMHFPIGKTEKIAINIQLNVEKRVFKAISIETRYQADTQAFAYLDADLDQLLEEPYANRWFQVRALLDQLSEDAVSRCTRAARRATNEELSDHAKAVLKGAINALVEDAVLSEEDARLLEEHIIHGKTIHEAAKGMGIKDSAARMRFLRAKERLQLYRHSERM